MLALYERIERLCQGKNINITEMCRRASVPRSALSDYKTGRKKTISLANLEKIADLFGISLDELTGRETAEKETAPPSLNKRDERDIEKRLLAMLGELDGPDAGSLMYSGEPLDDETRELLRISLRNQLELSKQLAKKKYTPKKFRKEGE